MLECVEHAFTSKVTPPPPKFPIVVFKLKEAYAAWIGVLAHMPKHTRYALGARIDGTLLSCAELVLGALYLPIPEKLAELKGAIGKLETTKFLLQLGWESKVIQTAHYAPLVEQLAEIGRMLGGWRRGLEAKLPGPRRTGTGR